MTLSAAFHPCFTSSLPASPRLRGAEDGLHPALGLQGAEGIALAHKHISFPQNGAFSHLLCQGLGLDIWDSGSISGIWVGEPQSARLTS